MWSQHYGPQHSYQADTQSICHPLLWASARRVENKDAPPTSPPPTQCQCSHQHQHCKCWHHQYWHQHCQHQCQYLNADTTTVNTDTARVSADMSMPMLPTLTLTPEGRHWEACIAGYPQGTYPPPLHLLYHANCPHPCPQVRQRCPTPPLS